jgi:lysyl-tRNA synthetase class 2
MTDHAKELRRAQTDAERKLWSRLRNAQLGIKFRRQHKAAGYILDFACLEKNLVIELDGSQHSEQTAYDNRRTIALEQLGFRVLRFWNTDALQNTDNVLATIVAALNEPRPPHPNPLPRQRRGRGSRSDSNGNSDAVASTAPSPPVRFSSEKRVGVRGQGPQNLIGQRNRGDPISCDRHRALRLRASLNTLIRSFFAERGVIEVETPILSRTGNTEPNIESFSTVFGGPANAGARTRYLRTSPEHPLKRLLAAGFGDCYELGRVFRNGEAGSSHNSEFTMLEWYRVGFDHRRLMLECAQLVRSALALAHRDASVTTTSYRDWFRDTLQLDPFTADVAALREPLRDYSISADGLTRDDWLDLLVTHHLQPALPDDAITIVYDFPASQCSLARIRPGHPPAAERFELYLGQHELANGYHELNDAAEQRARFERDNLRRRERGQDEMPFDEDLLAVLDQLPDCAGVALGVDRLLMHLLGSRDIRNVLAFAFAEA